MTTVDWLFVGLAAAGGALFFIRLALLFVGGDVDADMDIDVDVDADVDVGDAEFADSDISFRLLSLQAITAFVMMFGLTGLALRKQAELSEAWATLGGLAVGLIAMYVVAKIMAFMKGLQSDGTMVMANAVGQDGNVYLTIRTGSRGKVQATVQGRLMIFEAVSQDGQEIKTGERVKIVEVTGDNALVVVKQ